MLITKRICWNLHGSLAFDFVLHVSYGDLVEVEAIEEANITFLFQFISMSIFIIQKHILCVIP